MDNFFKKMYNDIDPYEEMQQLPQETKKELLLACFEYLKHEIALFKVDDNFTCHIIQHLQLLVRKKGDIVYRAGDFSENVYFLGSGRISLSKDDGKPFVFIEEGSFFGEKEILEGNNRMFFAVAEKKCHLYICSSVHFKSVLQEFPQVNQEVVEIMRRRQEKYKVCNMLLSSNQLPRNNLIGGQTLLRNNQHFLGLLEQHQRSVINKKTKIGFRICKSKKQINEEERHKSKQNEKALDEFKNKLLPSFSFKKRNRNIMDKTIKKFQTLSSIKSRQQVNLESIKEGDIESNQR